MAWHAARCLRARGARVEEKPIGKHKQNATPGHLRPQVHHAFREGMGACPPGRPGLFTKRMDWGRRPRKLRKVAIRYQQDSFVWRAYSYCGFLILPSPWRKAFRILGARAGCLHRRVHVNFFPTHVFEEVWDKLRSQFPRGIVKDNLLPALMR